MPFAKKGLKPPPLLPLRKRANKFAAQSENMRWIKRIFIVAISLYLLLLVGVFFAQERLLFLNEQLPETYQFRDGEEVELEVEKGIYLNCLWLKEPASKGVILYLHGNKGSNRRCLRQAGTFRGQGYDVFMPDYRGFGKSDGENRSEQQLYSDVQKVYDFLRQHYDESQIIIAGYSLGSGLATWLAANNNPSRVILVAPYVSMVYMKDKLFPFVPDFILKYPLRSDENLKKVKAPVTIVHGTEDELIPFESAEKLHRDFPGKTKLVPVPGAGHRRVIFSNVLRDVVRQIAQRS
jgi:hypothetical protein